MDDTTTLAKSGKRAGRTRNRRPEAALMGSYVYTDRLEPADRHALTTASADELDILPNPEPGVLWIRPPGAEHGADRWHHIGWPSPASLATAIIRHPTAIEIRSSELVIGTLPIDVEQLLPPDPLRLYLSSYLAWPAESNQPDTMQAAIIIEAGDDEIRLSLASAIVLVKALLALLGTADQPLTAD